MTSTHPQKISNNINYTLYQCGSGLSRFANEGDFFARRVLLEITQLERVSPIEASLHRAVLFSFLGKIDYSEHWLENARMLGATEFEIHPYELMIYLNMGFFSRAYSIIQLVSSNCSRENYSSGYFAKAGLICCAFKNTSGISVENHMDDCAIYSIEKGKQVMNTMPADFSELDLVRIIDVAGEVLRDNGILWQRDCPDVSLVDSDSPSLLYQFYVHESPEKANSMTEEVIARCIERDLLKDGLLFSFLSERG